VVGTHFPEDRDLLESALQRMTEAFESLRDGRVAPALAEEEFQAGYDTVRELASTFLLARRPPVAGDEQLPARPGLPD
jgi:hypothetical protein